jgi:hypothetical protein
MEKTQNAMNPLNLVTRILIKPCAFIKAKWMSIKFKRNYRWDPFLPDTLGIDFIVVRIVKDKSQSNQ